ncbi:hypothetical protein ACDX78_01620 [Virgibacillus oceani]
MKRLPLICKQIQELDLDCFFMEFIFWTSYEVKEGLIMEFFVMTFNIRHRKNSLDEIANTIVKSKADIIGLNEMGK